MPKPRNKIAIHPINIYGIKIRTKQNEMRKPANRTGGKITQSILRVLIKNRCKEGNKGYPKKDCCPRSKR